MKNLFNRAFSLILAAGLVVSTMATTVSAETADEGLDVGIVITKHETTAPIREDPPPEAVNASIYFTTINGYNDDKIELGSLLPDTAYTMHIVFKADEHYGIIRNPHLWLPIVAQDTTIWADGLNDLSCHLEGQVYNDDGELVDYKVTKSVTLYNNGKSDMSVRYEPGTAILFYQLAGDNPDESDKTVKFWLSDVDLCSNEFGAPVSSNLEMRYNSKIDDYEYCFP